MAELFDPYYQWLGIPPAEQPPHYYRLLGLQQFEHDPRTIAAAADQVAYHVRGYQVGPYLQYAQRLLAEVAAARACLLDLPQKAAYDQQLSMMLIARQPLQGGPYGVPFDAQLSPERPMAPPPPPGGFGPAMPAADTYGFQPMAPMNVYMPPEQTPPMAYPPSMAPVPSVLPQATVPVPTGYSQPPFSAPPSYPANRPPAPAPYPGAKGADSAAPPSEDEIVDDLESLDSETSSGARWRRSLHRRSEEPAYAGILVGVVILVVVLGIVMAKHPFDAPLTDPPPKPAAPAIRPKPPASESAGPKRPPGNRKPDGASKGVTNSREFKPPWKPGDMPAMPRNPERQNPDVPPLNLGEGSGL